MYRIVEGPLADVPARLIAQVLTLHDQAWPGPPSTQPLHDPALDPWSLLLLEEDAVLVSVDILRKTINHRGHTYRAGGLSSVVVRADRRGRGLGRRAVRAAREGMERLDLDLAIFTCDVHLQGFYEQCGFEHLPGTVLVGGTPGAPFPSDGPGFDKATMAAFFTDHAQAHRADFVDSRVELWPGTIDRLW